MFNVSMKSEAVEYSGTNDDGINQIWLPWLAFNEILTSPKKNSNTMRRIEVETRNHCLWKHIASIILVVN